MVAFQIEAGSPRGRIGTRTEGLLLVAVILVLGGLSLWGQVVSGTSPQLVAVDVGSIVLCSALVPLLQRHPPAGAVALGCLAALSPAATPAATLAALYVARRRPLSVAAVVASVGVLGHVGQALWRLQSGISLGWWIVLDLVAYTALVGAGALAQARDAAFQALCERAERAETEQGRRVLEARALERNKMAREMHDVLAHRLSLLATYAGALEYRPDSSPDRLAQAATVIRAGVGEALNELREVIGVLRVSDEEGDAGRHPQAGLADLPRLVEESRDVGMAVELTSSVTDPSGLPPSTQRAVYRVVQESLTNARKHAPGSPVRVGVEGHRGEAVRIEVENPTGAPVDDSATGTGTGLLGLTERVRLCGGSLDHWVGRDGRFVVRASLPWPA